MRRNLVALFMILLLAAQLISAEEVKFQKQRPGVYLQILRENSFAWYLDMDRYRVNYPVLRPNVWFGDPRLSWHTIASTPQAENCEFSFADNETIRLSNVRANTIHPGTRYPSLNDYFIEDVVEMMDRSEKLFLHYSDPENSHIRLNDFKGILSSPKITGFEFDTRDGKLFNSEWVDALVTNLELQHLTLDLPDIKGETLTRMRNLEHLLSFELKLGNPLKNWDGDDLDRMIRGMKSLKRFALVFAGGTDVEKTIKSLAELPKLKELYLEGDFWKYEPLKYISKLPLLEKLCFVNTTGFQPKDELLQLTTMPNLKHLEIHGAFALERKQLEDVAAMKSLEVLRIGGRSTIRTDLSKVRSTEWSKLFNASFRTFWVEANGINNSFIESLDRIPKLQNLVLMGDLTGISASAWEQLKRSTTLTHIELAGENAGISFSAIAELFQSRMFERIRIEKLVMIEEDRFSFTLPNKITHLDISFANVPYAALDKSRWGFDVLDNLEYLAFSCPTWVVREDMLKQFDECAKLRTLLISASDIEDPLAFAKATDAFPKLNTLCVTGFKLNEAAMKRIEDRTDLSVLAFEPLDTATVKRVTNPKSIKSLAMKISGDITLDFDPHSLKDMDESRYLQTLLLVFEDAQDWMYEKLLKESIDSKAKDVCINYGPDFRDFSLLENGNTNGPIDFPSLPQISQPTVREVAMQR